MNYMPSIAHQIVALRRGNVIDSNVPVRALDYGQDINFGGTTPGAHDFALNIAQHFVLEMGLEDAAMDYFDSNERKCRYGSVCVFAWDIHFDICQHFVAHMDPKNGRIDSEAVRAFIRMRAQEASGHTPQDAEAA